MGIDSFGRIVYIFGAEAEFSRGKPRGTETGRFATVKVVMRMSVYEAFMLVIEIAALVISVLSYIRSAKDDRKRK
jgi:hypothetical protein